MSRIIVLKFQKVQSSNTIDGTKTWDMFSTHVGNQLMVTIIGCMFSTHVGNQPIVTIIGCMFSTHVGNQPMVTIIGCMF